MTKGTDRILIWRLLGAEKTEFEKEACSPPGNLYDRLGNLIVLPVWWANLDTGYVLHDVYKDNMLVTNPQPYIAEIGIKHFLPPLRFEPTQEDNVYVAAEKAASKETS